MMLYDGIVLSCDDIWVGKESGHQMGGKPVAGSTIGWDIRKGRLVAAPRLWNILPSLPISFYHLVNFFLFWQVFAMLSR